jgi:hypothetical protein
MKAPELAPDPAESPAADEAELAAHLAAQIRTVIERQYAGDGAAPRALRDAHAKIVALVRAEVAVRADLPADLAHGVWRPGATYRAWIRYSNGAGEVQPDGERDARGMAVKLCAVPAVAGDRLPGDVEQATQDFVMIDHPVFFLSGARVYAEFVDRQVAGKSVLGFLFPSLWPWQWRLRTLLIMRALLKAPPSHLGQTYHSMTAYRLGPHVVKLRARPLGAVTPRTGDGADSLRAALEAHLAAGPARFALEVQRRPARGGDGFSVEDATVRWPEGEAPFETVAEITIPQQTCGSDAQRAFGDRLSFSPWHGLLAHRPLGSLNRMRRLVYPASSTLRHDLNRTPPIEPTGDEQP